MARFVASEWESVTTGAPAGPFSVYWMPIPFAVSFIWIPPNIEMEACPWV